MMGTTAVPSARATAGRTSSTATRQPASNPGVGGSTGATAGGDDAFRVLFDRTYPAVVAYARRRVTPDQVDDVVSEVYTIAWRRRNELREGDSPLPWLYGVAANVVRNLRRSGQRHLRLVERIDALPPARPLPGPDDQPGVELRAALERISFDDQEVLRLVAWEGLCHSEVAQVLDCSPNAVGIRVHRARKRLEIELARLRQNPTNHEEPD